MLKHRKYVSFSRTSEAGEAEDIVIHLIGDGLGGASDFTLVQHVLLEKGVLPVHVSAVEESVSADRLRPFFTHVFGVVVLLIFEIKFMTGDVLLLVLCLDFIHFSLNSCLSIVKGFAEATSKLVIQVYIDVGSGYLDKGFVSSAEEDEVLFVQMPENVVT